MVTLKRWCLPDQIDHYKHARPEVSFPAACTFLTTLRDRHRHTQNNVFLHDLTDSGEFDWKVWLSQRPDAADIVGPGICHFALRRLSSSFAFWERMWKRSITVLRSLPRLGRLRGGRVVAGAGGWRKFLDRQG